MKKLIIAFTSIFMMMIIIASPLFVNPLLTNAATSLGITDDTNTNEWFLALPNIKEHYGDDLYYAYVTLYENNGEAETVCLIFDDCELATDEGYTLRFSSTDIPLDVYIKNPTLNGGKAKIVRRHRNESGTVTVLQEISDYNIDYFGFRYDSTGTGNINYKVITSGSRTLQNGSTESLSINLYQTNVYRYNSSDTQHNQDRQTQFIIPTNDGLNVFVSFSPSLSGNVDRSINSNGVQSMRSQLYMQVVNQSRFPIQYKMAIYKKHQQTSRDWDLTVGDNVFYDSDPIFVYYSDSWVYCTNCDDENTFLNSDTVKENKASPWHYVAASSQDIVTFDFSQINLLEGEEYSVYVYAVRNDYGFSSEQIVYLASSDPAVAELKQIQGDNIETVYDSDFVMINYSDVTYDPNNSKNGVKPFNGRDGFAATQQYSYSRNARENQDGSIDYSSRNLYTNPNSWLSQQRSNALTNHSTYSSGSVPASLNNHFNGFFAFVNSIFGHLPKDIQSIYIYGFTAIVVLGIILKVVK